VSLGLAALCMALLIATFILRVPDWYTQATYLSDILMFAVGMILAIAMANVAIGEQVGRARLEKTLRDTWRSHNVQLTAYSAPGGRTVRRGRAQQAGPGTFMTASATTSPRSRSSWEKGRGVPRGRDSANGGSGAGRRPAHRRAQALDDVAHVRRRAARGTSRRTRLTAMLDRPGGGRPLPGTSE